MIHLFLYTKNDYWSVTHKHVTTEIILTWNTTFWQVTWMTSIIAIAKFNFFIDQKFVHVSSCFSLHVYITIKLSFWTSCISTGTTDKQSKQPDRSRSFRGKANQVNKCLRCQKIFNATDNHKLACCFHEKDKERVEIYTDGGQLVKVTYLWKCCNKSSDIDGCCYGHHVWRTNYHVNYNVT